MSILFWRRHEPNDTDIKHEAAREVDEQHALPVGIYFKGNGAQEAEEVNDGHRLPVVLPDSSALATHFDSSVVATLETMSPSPTTLYYIEARNTNNADVWVQLFEDAAVTLGTTAPKLSLFVPAQGAIDKYWQQGVKFKNLVSYAATTTSTGNTAPSTGITLNAGYLR